MMNTEKKQSGALRLAAKDGLASARANALPGLVLWIFASLVVAGYWLVPPVTKALQGLGELKTAGGFLYSCISTALFGGLIPYLWRLWLGRKTGKRAGLAGMTEPGGNNPGETSPGNSPATALDTSWKVGLFLCLFWAWKGIEVDAFYRLQTLIFGSGANAAAIIPKVLVDQFVYNPLWAAWTQVLAYYWMEQKFRSSALRDPSLWRTMGQRILTILISTWGVWIPMVSIIYAMPSDLQIPLFNIALCFWSLLLGSLVKEKR